MEHEQYPRKWGTAITAKQLYQWAVSNGFENLPLCYVADDTMGCPTEYRVEAPCYELEAIRLLGSYGCF